MLEINVGIIINLAFKSFLFRCASAFFLSFSLSSSVSLINRDLSSIALESSPSRNPLLVLGRGSPSVVVSSYDVLASYDFHLRQLIIEGIYFLENEIVIHNKFQSPAFVKFLIVFNSE